MYCLRKRFSFVTQYFNLKLLKETKNIHKFLKIWTQYVRFRTKSGLAKTKFLYLYISEYNINNVLENVMSNVKLVSNIFVTKTAA